jgi:hypothetical protein
VRAAEQVHAQLEFFRTDMLKDAAAQRRRVAVTAMAAAERAGAIVDRVLRLANASNLSSYLLASCVLTRSRTSAGSCRVAPNGGLTKRERCPSAGYFCW